MKKSHFENLFILKLTTMNKNIFLTQIYFLDINEHLNIAFHIFPFNLTLILVFLFTVGNKFLAIAHERHNPIFSSLGYFPPLD